MQSILTDYETIEPLYAQLKEAINRPGIGQNQSRRPVTLLNGTLPAFQYESYDCRRAINELIAEGVIYTIRVRVVRCEKKHPAETTMIGFLAR